MTSITSSLPKVTSSTAKVTSITDDASLKVSSGSYSQFGPFFYHQKLVILLPVMMNLKTMDGLL